MRMTYCDNCEKVLVEDKNEIEYFNPTIFILTKKPGSNPYTHEMTMPGQKEKSLVKHFCSEKCIGEYFQPPEKKEGMFEGSNINIKTECDIKQIAEEVAEHLKKMSAKG